MPLGYGSSLKTPILYREDLSVGIIHSTKKESVSGLTTFFRILTTIAEIAVGFTGIGAIGETAVGLIGGAINQALDAEEGNTSITGTLLNFATPFIGGAFASGNNLRQGNKITNELIGFNSVPLASKGGRFAELINEGGRGIEQGTFQAFKQGQRIENNFRQFSTLQKFNKGTSLFPKGALKNGFGGYVASQSISYGLGLNSKLTGLAFRETDNIIREAAEEGRFIKFLEKSGLTLEKQWELQSVLKGIDNYDDMRSVILGFLRDLPAKESLRLFRNVSNEIEVVALSEAWQLPFAKQVMNEFDAYAAETMDEEFLKQEVPSLWKRIVRKVGSPQFNDKIVQRAQLIDPNDAGRAGVEHTYQIIKKWIRTLFKEVEEADKIEDAFVKGGGTLVDSDWHLGYKVIKDLGINKQMVQITYGKDTGKYRHVMVFANDSELRQYILNPGKTYLNLWAFSRGGKALGLESIINFSGIKSLGFQAATVLGFIPIQALKNILSLVSNYVENGADIVNGTYANTYTKKFTTSLRNSAISRTFRLLGKEILGGIAGKYLGQKVGKFIGIEAKKVGDFIGREAQRVGTQIISTGIKNVIAGNDFNKGLAEKAEAGVLVSIRSNALRSLRTKRHNSAIVQILSARRKLQQVKRIPNAVVPGRPFKGIKI